MVVGHKKADLDSVDREYMDGLVKKATTIILFLTGGFIGWCITAYFRIQSSAAIYEEAGIDPLNQYFRFMKPYILAYVGALVIYILVRVVVSYLQKKKGIYEK